MSRKGIVASIILALILAVEIGVVGCGQSKPLGDTTSNQPTPEVSSISKPKGLTAIGGDTIVYLTWEANPEPDIEWYYIYCSVGTNDAYSTTSIARTKEASFEHRQLNMGNAYYYKIKACDKSGRYSDFSDEVGVLPKEKYVLVSEFIEKGTEESQLDFPMYMAIDTSGNLYFTDYNMHYVKKYDSAGNFIKRWGGHGGSNGQFFGPAGIAVSKWGFVFVADLGYYDPGVQVFSSDGEFSVKWGTEGSGEGQLEEPRGVAVYENPDLGEYYIFVADARNHRVQKYAFNGEFIAEWGGYGSAEGKLIDPYGIAVNSKGDVYVGDTYYLHKYSTTNGKDYLFVKRWQTLHGGGGPTNPWFIAIDRNDNVYAYLPDRIKKYDSDGNFITDWSIAELGGSFAIAINENDEVYIARTFDKRYIISKYKKE